MKQAGSPPDERRSYYAADGKLARVVARNASSTQPTGLSWYRENVEVYCYDALGRRVWLKSDKDCKETQLLPDDALLCQISMIRRTVWDLDQELGEIQMPGDSTPRELPYWENDTNAVLLPDTTAGGRTADKNPFYGRVLYTHGGGLDRPLAIYRMGYSFATDTLGFAVTPQEFGRFTINPFWNQQGEAVLGSYETGNGINCKPVGSRTACVRILWPYVWSAYDRDRGLVRTSWHGSLLESRRDGSGLRYKRNRFYDPAAGRFTQEDPIGFAGGLNLYGFAEGDPVNFSDPFGLCTDLTDPRCRFIQGVAGRVDPLERVVPEIALAQASILLPMVPGPYGGATASLNLATPLGVRAKQIHSVLDGIAHGMRTTAVARVRTAAGQLETWVASAHRHSLGRNGLCSAQVRKQYGASDTRRKPL